MQARQKTLPPLLLPQQEVVSAPGATIIALPRPFGAEEALRLYELIQKVLTNSQNRPPAYWTRI